MDFSAFRDNLARLIESRGSQKKDIAFNVGITPATISRYLSGHRDPDLEYVVRLAEYFGVSVDWLLGMDIEKHDAMTEETRELVRLYSLAGPDDRRVIQAVLAKYREA